jgi:Protein of unknown function (DUF2971)
MAITDDDKARYVRLAVQVALELNVASIAPDTILWHYTTGSTLISIFESMSLYSTQLSCLNDSTELRYASKHFQHALRATRAAITSTGLAADLLDGALEYFKEDPDAPFQAGVFHFVTCFSEDRDDLGQWRGYGTGENGYAIGFRAQDLVGVRDAILIRVNYDSALHERLAHGIVDAMVTFFEEAMTKYAPTDPVTFGKEFLGVWDDAIVMVAPSVKDPGFRGERECRVVKTLHDDELSQLKFIQKSTMMTRHLPIKPPAGNSFTPYRLPIAEVIVGPCRHPHVSRISVDTLLRQKGYPTGMVSISKIPYQST